jgi:RHS repeat-associated protein
VVVSQSGSVEQINHYYPYGALFAESTNGDVQRFKYNGLLSDVTNGNKELDRKFGLNWYDHGARHNDAAIGRWHCIDKNAEKYYGISPYAYCGGDPVNGVDLNGEVTIFVNGFRLLYAAADMTSNPSGGKKSVYQKTDIFDYWDDKIIEYYKKEYHETDETMYFTSGSSYPTSSASLREKEGEAKAMIFNDKVLQGEFSVDKKEPIRLVSHSLGGATAAGMAAKLKELGYNVEIIEYITPHQATDIHHPKGVKGIQYDQKFDRVVDDDKKEIINGIDPNAFFEDEKHRSSLLGGHSNSDNLEIIKNGAK